MAETLILQGQTITTSYIEAFGCYAAAISPPPFSLTIGEKYKVLWDEQTWDVEAIDCSAVTGDVGIGNGTPFGLSGNNEPFVAVYTDNVEVSFVALTDTAPTEHTVAVYHVTEDEPSEEPEAPEGIVLKDRNGNDVAYYGIETVTFDTTTEGKQQTYTKGVVIPEMEVPVTFANGDMPIEADAGHLIKKIILQKPDTLKPENIRAGVNVAAVTGEFIGAREPYVEFTQDGDGNITSVKPCGFTVIPTAMVSFYSKMTTIDFGASPNLAEIKGDAFKYSGLASCEIPESVTTLGNTLFQNCTSLKSVSLPSGISAIGASTFNGCTALKTLVIPENVKSIGAYAFLNSGVTSVTFENPKGWWYSTSSTATTGTSIPESTLSNPSAAASWLKTNNTYYLHRS